MLWYDLSAMADMPDGSKESSGGGESSSGGVAGRAIRSGSARHLLDGVAVLIFSLSVVTVFLWIHHFAVNMIYFDQWADVAVVQHAHSGTLSLAVLWAQHNENRILFPNLIVLLLAYTTHLDVVIEDYLNGALAIAAAGLLILAHKRRSPAIPWIWYCPVAVVLLSFVPLENALFGFNLSWYLVLCGLSLSLYLLDQPTLGPVILLGAVATGVVASYSSIQGLFIWPAGLVLLYLRRRARAPVVAWVVSGIVTWAVYFIHFDFAATGGDGLYSLRHPLAAVEFFFSAIGNVLGSPISAAPHAGNDNALTLGIIVFAVAVVALVNGFHRGRSGGAPIGVALICFGLGFIAFITIGRIQLGLFNESRDTVFTLLVWVGTYLTLLESPSPELRDAASRWMQRFDDRMGINSRPTDVVLGGERPRGVPWRQATAGLALVVLMGLLVLQVGFGFEGGTNDARGWYQSEMTAANVTVNIDKASDSLVVSALGGYPTDFFRQTAMFARRQRLSLFDTGLVAEDTLRNPVPVILLPAPGAILTGSADLDATVSGRAISVEFEVTDPGRRSIVVGTGLRTEFGWFARWDTTTVSNGSYRLECVVDSAAGVRTTGLPVHVTVENRGEGS